MMLLVTLLLGAVVIYLLHHLLSKANNYWTDRGIPTFPGSALFGHMTDVILRKKSMGEITLHMYRALEGHKIGGYIQFKTPVLMIRDPDLINTFLIKDFTNFHDRNLPTSEEFDLFGASLNNLTGERWRSMRYKLLPTFTSGKLKRMFDQIVTCSDEIIEHIDTIPKGEAAEARDISFNFTINVIGLVAFGLKIDSHKVEEGKNNIFVEMSKRIFKPSIVMFVKFFMRMSYPKLMETLGVKTNDSEMSDFFTTLVSDTVKYRQETGTHREDFLQLLIDIRNKSKSNNKKPEVVEEFEAEDNVLMDQLKNVPAVKPSYDVELSDNVMAAQAFVFIAGGSESISTVLHFALFQIANNQRVQTKLQSEIGTVLKNRSFDYEAVKKMTYLENVLNETLRLQPPGAILARYCTENFRIPDTDIVVEKGTQVNIPVIGLHRDPKYFTDPELFNPDRFDEEIPKGVFFPFGGGPRICIAMRLSMLVMKIFLARVMMKYLVKVSSKTQVPLKLRSDSLVQHVKGGVWLHFEKRN